MRVKLLTIKDSGLANQTKRKHQAIPQATQLLLLKPLGLKKILLVFGKILYTEKMQLFNIPIAFYLAYVNLHLLSGHPVPSDIVSSEDIDILKVSFNFIKLHIGDTGKRNCHDSDHSKYNYFVLWGWMKVQLSSF